jgi:DNA-binding CsgD family transcriptional regulator
MQNGNEVLSSLTLGEAELLADIAGHFTQPQIARRRGVSRNTVRKQVSALEEKIGVHSMGEAARFWQDNGGAWLRSVAARVRVELPHAQ